MELPDHFWSKVVKTGDCWLWTAAQSKEGYGHFWLDGKCWQAHILSYVAAIGEVPRGHVLDHRCHVEACVNPAHLVPATHKQNMENRKGAPKNSLTGIRGVSWHKKRQRFVARVRHNGKLIHVGEYRDRDSAEQAAIDMRNQLFTNNLQDKENIDRTKV